MSLTALIEGSAARRWTVECAARGEQPHDRGAVKGMPRAEASASMAADRSPDACRRHVHRLDSGRALRAV